MYNFFEQNAGTIIVGIAVAVIIVFVIRKLIKDFKDGKTSCGCGCSGCSQKGCPSQTDNGN